MTWSRMYFAVQAVAGIGWWIAVFLSPTIRSATIGQLDPVTVAVFDVPLFVVMSAIAAFGSRWAALIATCWTGLVTVGLAAYATVTTLAGLGVVLMAAATAASVVALSLMWTGRIALDIVLVGPMRFDTADPSASPGRHVAATALQILIFWSLFLGVIPLAIRSLERRWMLSLTFPPEVSIVGVVILCGASALGIWAAAVMSRLGAGTPLPSSAATLLVIAGPYRFVRNPMALAGIVQGAAVGLIMSSWLVVAYAVCGSLVWNFAVRPYEERDLEARFGDAFRDYRQKVRCWWPRFRPNPGSISPAADAG